MLVMAARSEVVLLRGTHFVATSLGVVRIISCPAGL